jgi:hypothetical protein
VEERVTVVLDRVIVLDRVLERVVIRSNDN